LCTSSDVCTSPQVCDKSFTIGKSKSYNCLPDQEGPLSSVTGSVTAQWDFSNPKNNIGSGSASFFGSDTGPPLLFNCSFHECTQSISSDRKYQLAMCQITSCKCTSLCSALIKSYIEGMRSSARFSCEIANGKCSLSQKELLFPIDVDCAEAAGCNEKTTTPTQPNTIHWYQTSDGTSPERESGKSSKKLIAGIAVAVVFAVGAVVGVGYWLYKKKGKRSGSSEVELNTSYAKVIDEDEDQEEVVDKE